jgi:hypothetical protein
MDADQIVEKIEQGDHQFVNEFFATQKQRYLKAIDNEADPYKKNELTDKYNELASFIHNEYEDNIKKTSYGVLKSTINWKIEKKHCTCEPNKDMKAALRSLNQLTIQERKDEKEAFKAAFKEDN